MGVFSRFTLKSLRRNRVRTLVTVAGVALSCALITAVLTSITSFQDLLLRATIVEEGAWQLQARGLDRSEVAELAQDGHVTDLACSYEIGAAPYNRGGNVSEEGYLFLRTLPTAADGSAPAEGEGGLVPPLRLDSGRLPENGSEIALPVDLEGASFLPADAGSTGFPGVSGTAELGAELTLTLGGREATDLETGETVPLASRTDLFDESGEERFGDERFIPGEAARSYTVVGFYRADQKDLHPQASGFYALTGPDAPEGEYAVAYLSTDLSSREELTAFADSVSSLAQDGTELHASLLRYQGLNEDRQLFDTLYAIGGILAAIIMVASVSLIYNSFAISVSERTRQFGLLSSLGASKRQLRRTVLVEALLIGCIGIPIGIVLGLAGCAVVFHFTSAGIAAMFGGGEVALRVTPDPLMLGTAVLLTVIVLLLSSWMPSRRAGRVSAVDAIRQTQDVRLPRRAARAAEKRARTAAPHFLTERDVRPHGLAARVFGVPGFVAHRNLSRNTSKGRVAIASLAISVTLLVTAGTLANSLSYAAGTAVDGMEGVDVMAMVSPRDGNRELDRKELDAVLDEARSLEGVERASCAVREYRIASIPAGMLESDMGTEELRSYLGIADDGSCNGSISLAYVDDATWNALADDCGLSEQERQEPGTAIAANGATTMTLNGSYASFRPWTSTGDLELMEFKPYDGLSFSGVDETGETALYFDQTTGDPVEKPVSEALANSRGLHIAALAENPPSHLSNAERTLVLPMDALGDVGIVGDEGGEGEAAYVGTDIVLDTGGSIDGASQTADEIEGIVEKHLDASVYVSNVAEGKMQSRLMSQTVQTFIYCFAAITGLIAAANVFNTLANSIILRRREFAVLKSVGMGNRAFLGMIAYECGSYAVRGMLIGLALATLASWGMYQALQMSFIGVSFGLPWGHVALSLALTLAVLAASVAFALHRSRREGIVDALRNEAL